MVWPFVGQEMPHISEIVQALEMKRHYWISLLVGLDNDIEKSRKFPRREKLVIPCTAQCEFWGSIPHFRAVSIPTTLVIQPSWVKSSFIPEGMSKALTRMSFESFFFESQVIDLA